MKTFTLALLCLLCNASLIAKANSPPTVIADIITIQIIPGKGSDCHRGGRDCLWAQEMSIGETPSTNAEGVAKAWFDEQGHFVMEIRQVLKTTLWDELEGGSFLLDSQVSLPSAIMSALGREGQSYTLASGMHVVKKQTDGSYRIVF